MFPITKPSLVIRIFPAITVWRVCEEISLQTSRFRIVRISHTFEPTCLQGNFPASRSGVFAGRFPCKRHGSRLQGNFPAITVWRVYEEISLQTSGFRIVRIFPHTFEPTRLQGNFPATWITVSHVCEGGFLTNVMGNDCEDISSQLWTNWTYTVAR